MVASKSEEVETPNKTFVSREVAEAMGIVGPKTKAKRKTTTRKPAARKAVGVTRKGK